MFKPLVVIILIETLHTLSILIFACTYFCELKKSYFVSTYVCEWQAFENFEFINFRPKEKRIRKRQLNQRICERQYDNGKTGRSQWKNCCYWLILKKTALTNIFYGIWYIYGIQNQKHCLSSKFRHLSFSRLIYTQVTFEKSFYNFLCYN